MQADDAALSLPKGFEVGHGVRGIEGAEVVGRTGYGELRRLLPRDLDEQPVGRTALVELTRRVQIARREAQCRRDPKSIAQERAQRLERLLDLGTRLEMDLEGEIVPGPRAGEMTGDALRHRHRLWIGASHYGDAGLLDVRLPLGQPPSLRPLGEEA